MTTPDLVNLSGLLDDAKCFAFGSIQTRGVLGRSGYVLAYGERVGQWRSLWPDVTTPRVCTPPRRTFIRDGAEAVRNAGGPRNVSVTHPPDRAAKPST
jgi:hypothetical protein